MDTEQEYAWKSGVLQYLWIQVVIFLGLVLCCTHLSEITLTIAANAFYTACFFIGKLYWLAFTDISLNSDTVIRLAYAHYISAIILVVLGIYHGVDMHYDWKSGSIFDGIKQELNWFDEAVINELGKCLDYLAFIGFIYFLLYTEPEALNYEIFMWGDVGMVTDVRFYGVAPHWYFRPYMAWLIVCPFHYAGLLGLLLFFVSFYYQPNIVGRGENTLYSSLESFIMFFYVNFKDRCKKIAQIYKISPETDVFYKITYGIFLICIWYAFSYLPYGRFFVRIGGNDSSLGAYIYIFIYMSGTYLRIPQFYNLYKTLYL